MSLRSVLRLHQIEAASDFDLLEPLSPAECVGRWRGREIRTGHPFEGLLSAAGWYGKIIENEEAVHPLVFRDRADREYSLNPRLIPVRLLLRRPRLVRTLLHLPFVKRLLPLLSGRRPFARIRTVAAGGIPSAAIIYDGQPILDAMRRIDHDTLMGRMELRGMAEPFFFLLERESSPVVAPLHHSKPR